MKLYFLLCHVFPLCIAWLLLVPFSIATAYLRRSWRYWFRWHILINVLAMLFMIVGCTTGIMKSSGKHVDNFHRQCGMTLIFLTLFQLALGAYISYMYNPDRSTIPITDISHWWLGRACVILAFITILSGMMWKELSPNLIIVICLYGAILCGSATVTSAEMDNSDDDDSLNQSLLM